jgi:hypothetical protein
MQQVQKLLIPLVLILFLTISVLVHLCRNKTEQVKPDTNTTILKLDSVRDEKDSVKHSIDTLIFKADGMTGEDITNEDIKEALEWLKNH